MQRSSKVVANQLHDDSPKDALLDLTARRKPAADGVGGRRLMARGPERLRHITRAVKRRLKTLQYRPQVIDGCLHGTGLVLDG
jgi:hypothetical protein